jgi:hypothetical protein
MKKLTILICVLAMLLALTGVASASPEQPKKFRIKGYTIGFYMDWSQTQPPCTAIVWSGGKVIQHIHGTFEMVEYLHFSNDSCFSVFQQFMVGQMPIPDYNFGILTISPKKGDTVGIGFAGYTDGETVWGDFQVNSGAEGQGAYNGIADTCTITNLDPFEFECTGFYVDFTFATGSD